MTQIAADLEKTNKIKLVIVEGNDMFDPPLPQKQLIISRNKCQFMSQFMALKSTTSNTGGGSPV